MYLLKIIFLRLLMQKTFNALLYKQNGSIAKRIFLQFDIIIFIFMYLFRSNENN
jgi:hypothetical protein